MPSTVAPVAPTGLAASGLSTTTPHLTWNSVGGADHYDVWIDDLTTGQSAVMRNREVTGTSWTAQGLMPGHDYRWWVGAVSNTGAVSWSNSTTFDVSALTAPTLNAPHWTPIPTFSWTAVNMTSEYEIWLNDLTTGGNMVVDQMVTANSWALNLPVTHDYRLWVRAWDGGTVSPWSQSIDLFTAPTLVGPSGSSALLPTFTWNGAAGAAHYDIWVDDLTTGQSAVIRNQDIVGTSWTPTTHLTAGDKYRWWVRAVTSANMDSAWSSPLDFSAMATA
jgi:hypothetical protein